MYRYKLYTHTRNIYVHTIVDFIIYLFIYFLKLVITRDAYLYPSVAMPGNR